MSYFLYGDNQSKINDEILKILSQENYTKSEKELSEENYLELGSTVLSENLFGDKLLYIIEITETENEIIENFFSDKKLTELSNLIVVYRKNLTSNSKIFSFLKGFEVKELKDVGESIFELVDKIIKGDVSLTYKEIEKHKKVDDIYVFNMAVSGFRNIEYIVFGMDQQSKIPPFKKGMYQKIAQNYTKEKIKKVSQKLFEYDLKFKTSELTADMLLTSIIILFSKK